MKVVALLLIVLGLPSCGQNSSPEGRMTKQMNEIRQEIDSLKKQNTMILDSLTKINQRLDKVKQ